MLSVRAFPERIDQRRKTGTSSRLGVQLGTSLPFLFIGTDASKQPPLALGAAETHHQSLAAQHPLKLRAKVSLYFPEFREVFWKPLSTSSETTHRFSVKHISAKRERCSRNLLVLPQRQHTGVLANT